MPKLPHIQFYTGDWIKDPRLAMCSLATRGVWIDLLCAIHESGEGRITATADLLSRLARCSPTEIESALAELAMTDTADILAETTNGVRTYTVTSRRMLREAQIRQMRAEAGALGGSKKASKRLANFHSENPSKPPSKTPSKRVANTDTDIDNDVSVVVPGGCKGGAESRPGTGDRPAEDEFLAFCTAPPCGRLLPAEAESLWLKAESVAWHTGGQPIRDWRAWTLRQFKFIEQDRAQNRGGNGAGYRQSAAEIKARLSAIAEEISKAMPSFCGSTAEQSDQRIAWLQKNPETGARLSKLKADQKSLREKLASEK